MAFAISPINIVQGACDGMQINSMSSPLVAHPFYVTRHSFKISRQNLKFEISQSKDWQSNRLSRMDYGLLIGLFIPRCTQYCALIDEHPILL